MKKWSKKALLSEKVAKVPYSAQLICFFLLIHKYITHIKKKLHIMGEDKGTRKSFPSLRVRDGLGGQGKCISINIQRWSKNLRAGFF